MSSVTIPLISLQNVPLEEALVLRHEGHLLLVGECLYKYKLQDVYRDKPITGMVLEDIATLYKICHHGKVIPERDILIATAMENILPNQLFFEGNTFEVGDKVKMLKTVTVNSTSHAYFTVYPFYERKERRPSGVQVSTDELVVSHVYGDGTCMLEGTSTLNKMSGELICKKLNLVPYLV